MKRGAIHQVAGPFRRSQQDHCAFLHAVLGLSQPYVFIGLAYSLLVVVVLGFQLTYDSSCSSNPARNCI